MTLKYGKDGSIDTAVLNGYGEPAFTPVSGVSWANELIGSDGAYRVMVSGEAYGRGVGNVFDTMLAKNFTILQLVRKSKGNTLYDSYCSKNIAPTTGWTVNYFHSHVSTQSMYSAEYNGVANYNGVNSYTTPDKNAKNIVDGSWHWAGFSISDTNTQWYFDAQAVGAPVGRVLSGSVDLTSTGTFKLHAGSGKQIAVTLIYNRVLTVVEVSDIMSGKVRPNNVPGLQGYYKLNETHGNSSGQCTDYSGAGNHLTYAGAVWATYIPYGSELNTPAQWSVFGGSGIAINVVTGVATFTSPAAYSGVNLTTTSLGAKKTYKASFTVSNYVSGTIVVKGSNAVNPNSISANGRHSLTFTTTSASVPILQAGGASFVGIVSDISLTEIRSAGAPYEHSFPYIKPSLRRPGNWWERTPPAIADPDRIGSVASVVSIGTPANATTAAAFAPQGDFSVSTWIKTQKQMEDISAFWGWGASAYQGVCIIFANANSASNRITVVLGNGTTKQDVEIWLGASSLRIPMNTWVHLVVKRAGNTVYAYLNGVLAGFKDFTPSVAISTTGAHFLNQGYLTTRSVRLFHRAITNEEVEELYYTDSIDNRTDLVGEWLMNDVSTNFCANTSDLGSALNSNTFTGAKSIDSPYLAPRRKRIGKALRTYASGTAQYATSSNAILMLGHTLSAWVKFSGKIIAAGGTVFGQATNGFQIRLLSSGAIEVLKSGIVSLATTSYKVPLNTWVLIAAYCDSTSLKIYANGALVFSSTGTYTFNSLVYAIAAKPADIGAERFIGAIDAVRIHNRSLTAEEHYRLYLDEVPRNGLIAEYGFDRVNLLAYSEDLTQGAFWSGTSGSPIVTANSITRTTTAPTYKSQVVNKPSSTPMSMTFYTEVKADTATHYATRIQGLYPAFAEMVVRLSDGVITTGPTNSGTFSNASAVVTALSDGWYGVSITATSDANSNVSAYHSFSSNGVVIDGTDSSAVSSGHVRKSHLQLGDKFVTYEPVLDAGTYCADTSGNNYHATWSGINVANYVTEY